MADHKLVVFGALGLVGRAVVQLLAGRPEWQVVGISRRQGDFATPATFISLDLTNRHACQQLLATPQFADTTHVVFAALFEKPSLVAGWRDPEQIATNDAMLRNALDPLLTVSGPAHISVLQGTKAYGVHFGFPALPGKESAPRPPGDNFYWQQEDYLREQHRLHGFAFTIFRPQIVCGVAAGSPMNVVAALGAYAAIARAQGDALHFPGGGLFVTEATDARLLARAIHWAGQTPAAANQTYNVTNGDVLVWQTLWQEFAALWQLEVGDAEPQLLADTMPKHEGLWRRIAAEHNLRTTSLAEMVGSSWQFLDATMAYGRTPQPVLLSSVKIRQHGFADCIDTATMLNELIHQYRALRMLPL